MGTNSFMHTKLIINLCITKIGLMTIVMLPVSQNNNSEVLNAVMILRVISAVMAHGINFQYVLIPTDDLYFLLWDTFYTVLQTVLATPHWFA